LNARTAPVETMVCRAADGAASTVTAKATSRIKREQIQYIVFEGGGGKGLAYLGALQALEEKAAHGKPVEPVLKYEGGRLAKPGKGGGRIKGIGGASAGAITAFLVSIGYTAAQVEEFMKKDFTTFFDTYEIGSKWVPNINGYRAIDVTPEEEEARLFIREFEHAIQDIFNDRELDGWFEKFWRKAESLSGIARTRHVLQITHLIWKGYGLYKRLSKRMDESDAAKAWLGARPDPRPIGWILGGVFAILRQFKCIREMDFFGKKPGQQIWDLYAAYFSRLDHDMGLFSRKAAFELFSETLAARMPGHDGKTVTFRQHQEFFGVELMLTGTNVETGKTQVFNCIQTPDFPLVHAVCISMGIPFAFKPYVIRKNANPVCNGVWVDGGVFNNFPLEEFEGRQEPSGIPGLKTLGLRLELEEPKPVFDGLGFIKQYALNSLSGAGESQATSMKADHMIILDTEGLDTMNFKPDDEPKKKAIEAAGERIRLFFDGTTLAIHPEYAYYGCGTGYCADGEIMNFDSVERTVRLKMITGGLDVYEPEELRIKREVKVLPGHRLRFKIGSTRDAKGDPKNLIAGEAHFDSGQDLLVMNFVPLR
jgi:predicted acylesterase/phospholipase RssA